MGNVEQRGKGDETRPLTVIPDANVLIHGKSLSELPWADLCSSTIEVLFVPPTIRELDKLKTQTGRPNKIARQLSSDIRTLINAPGRRAEVRKSGPAVSKRVELRSVTEAIQPALRLDHPDQALINYALHLQRDGIDVLLLTDDTICGTTAQEVGLPTHFLPERWLRHPEPDESGKENAKFKAEIQRLRAAEPSVALAFRDRAGASLKRYKASLTRWSALSGAELDELMDEVRRRCPQATSFERQEPRATSRVSEALAALERMSQLSTLAPRSVHEPATEKEIESYRTNEYPNWLNSVREALESVHLKLDARTQWPTMLAVAANVGTRPAIETLLSMRARGAFAILNDESDDRNEDDEAGEPGEEAVDRLELPLPPRPPRGRVKTIDPFSAYRRLGAEAFATGRALPLEIPRLAAPKPRESDAFYWRTGRRIWVSLMELECASWRHGQDDLVFVLRFRPHQLIETTGAIELTVHAHNISDPEVVRLPIRVAFEEGSTVEEARTLVEMLGRAARAQRRL